jgi:hypothetical protein
MTDRNDIALPSGLPRTALEAETAPSLIDRNRQRAFEAGRRAAIGLATATTGFVASPIPRRSNGIVGYWSRWALRVQRQAGSPSPNWRGGAMPWRPVYSPTRGIRGRSTGLPPSGSASASHGATVGAGRQWSRLHSRSTLRRCRSSASCRRTSRSGSSPNSDARATILADRATSNVRFHTVVSQQLRERRLSAPLTSPPPPGERPLAAQRVGGAGSSTRPVRQWGRSSRADPSRHSVAAIALPRRPIRSEWPRSVRLRQHPSRLG